MNHELTAATNRLALVLEQENAALSARDLTAAMGFVAEKRLALEGFVQAQETGDTATSTAVSLAAAARLKDLACENRALLARAIAAQSRVIGIVARAFPPDRNPLYAASGSIARPARPIAVTLSARA